jgi:hypothetical protein
MHSSVQQPAEPAVALADGPTGEIPGAMFQHFTSLFAGADAVNASTALAQAAVVRGLGLGHLDVAAAA